MSARARQARTARDEFGNDTEPSERTCAVTRAKRDPDHLIRFVRGPDGTIVPDLARRLPGRGVWISDHKSTVAAAALGNVFARSLKMAVIVPPGLADSVGDLILKRTLDTLGLANKAGLVLAGFTKVDKAIAEGEIIALVHASDAAKDGSGKLDRKLYAVNAEMAEEGARAVQPRVVSELTSAELSLAIGRFNVIHAGLRKGGAAQNFLRETERLHRYRSIAQIETASPSSSGLDTDQV